MKESDTVYKFWAKQTKESEEQTKQKSTLAK